MDNASGNENENIDWNSEDDREASSSNSFRLDLFHQFVEMGYPDKLVEKAIEENGDKTVEQILNTLCTYSALESSPEAVEASPQEKNTLTQSLESSPEGNEQPPDVDSDFGSSDDNENISDSDSCWSGDEVDTVAYHLSPLKDKFPRGLNVLSLFSGIGGAEVALHRLGIQLNTVVSAEKSEVNRNIVRDFWEHTNQTGTLIDFDDVQRVDSDKLAKIMNSIGGFDLVIGGSPCNNLTGSNRHHRDGLEGDESILFFEYFRILDVVKGWVKNNRVGLC